LHARALWDAIVADDPTAAEGFFFPLSAYVQVKAISDPTQDWNTRLLRAYEQDIHTWHTRVVAGAQLVALDVPTGQAQWILPGTESNKGSYWRVYGSQLRYQVGDRMAAFTIASMISWRGEWYVVQLDSIR